MVVNKADDFDIGPDVQSRASRQEYIVTIGYYNPVSDHGGPGYDQRRADRHSQTAGSRLMLRHLTIAAGAILFAWIVPVRSDADPAIVPVHGTVLAQTGARTIVATIDAVTGVSPAHTLRFTTAARVRAGEGFDALLDRAKNELDDVHPAGSFVAGMPNKLITHVLARGDRLPAYRFVAQDGRIRTFDQYRGKAVLLSFIYTRCPDREICPAISGKYAYLQHHLDPRNVQLVELTLDPSADSPVVLAAYGKRFGADPARWSLLTGEGAQIKNVLDSFGLDPLETDPGRIIHGDALIILDRNGTIADLIPTSGWEPDDVIATVDNVLGVASNPLRRFELATIAGVIAFCGGSISTGTVILDSAVFLAGVCFLGGLLIWITKRVIVDERY